MLKGNNSETDNLFSRFQGLDQAMGKLSESLLDTRQIEWTIFDQRSANSDEFFKSSLFLDSNFRKTQYMEELFDPMHAIQRFGAVQTNIAFEDESNYNVILYNPGKFAYFDGKLLALTNSTTSSMEEEICKIVLKYLFYSDRERDISVFLDLLDRLSNPNGPKISKREHNKQSLNFSIIKSNPPKSSKPLSNLQNFFSTMSAIDISFFDSPIENDDQMSTFDQTSSFFQIDSNKILSDDEITGHIDYLSSVLIKNLEKL